MRLMRTLVISCVKFYMCCMDFTLILELYYFDFKLDEIFDEKDNFVC